MSCGEGIATRLVACITLEELEEQMSHPTQCELELQPPREKICNNEPCVKEKDYDIISISSNSVVGSAHWRAGPWGGVSELLTELSCANISINVILLIPVFCYLWSWLAEKAGYLSR